MIASLRGRVVSLRLDAVVLEVGGVGLLVQATPGTLAELRPGQEAQLATSMVVREDALTLFGFANDDERDVFETVQTVSGIGPRLALAMLAVASCLFTASLEAGWIWAYHGYAPSGTLRNNFTLDLGIAPAWQIIYFLFMNQCINICISYYLLSAKMVNIC